MEKKLNTRACTHKRYCRRVYKISLYFIFFKLYLQMTKITKIISSMKSNEHNNNKKQISISSDRTLNKCIKNVFALWKIKYKITKRTRIKEEKKHERLGVGVRGRGESGETEKRDVVCGAKILWILSHQTILLNLWSHYVGLWGEGGRRGSEERWGREEKDFLYNVFCLVSLFKVHVDILFAFLLVNYCLAISTRKDKPYYCLCIANFVSTPIVDIIRIMMLYGCGSDEKDFQTSGFESCPRPKVWKVTHTGRQLLTSRSEVL